MPAFMLNSFGRLPLPAAFFLPTVAAAARFVSPTPFGSILGVLCVLRLPPLILDRVYAHLAEIVSASSVVNATHVEHLSFGLSRRASVGARDAATLVAYGRSRTHQGP